MNEHKMVRYEQLKKAIEKLWEKAKGKFAKLDEKNVFKEDNTFGKNVCIADGTMYTSIVQASLTGGGGTKKIGHRSHHSHSHGNNGYVTSLVIKTAGNIPLTTMTNMKVWEVKRGETRATDEVLNSGNPIIDGNTYEIKEAHGYDRCIEIPINKYYETPTYFIYQFLTPNHTGFFNSPNDGERVFSSCFNH